MQVLQLAAQAPSDTTADQVVARAKKYMRFLVKPENGEETTPLTPRS